MNELNFSKILITDAEVSGSELLRQILTEHYPNLSQIQLYSSLEEIPNESKNGNSTLVFLDQNVMVSDSNLMNKYQEEHLVVITGIDPIEKRDLPTSSPPLQLLKPYSPMEVIRVMEEILKRRLEVEE